MDYLGAGTVEFLADETGRFFFLEMNTRLQVEHPVTECTTGLDLVELQIEVAAGTSSCRRPTRTARGHSIEVRLYAEDPAADWTAPERGAAPLRGARRTHPSSICSTGPESAWTARWTSGSVIGVNFDPMLAKVISWAPTRNTAANMLAAALARSAHPRRRAPTATCS